MTRTRLEAERRGCKGETLAAWWLRLRGWRIVARRLKIRVGEVDLVARRDWTVAFVEVKWRATDAELDLVIDERRLQRVARATEALSPRYARNGEDADRRAAACAAPLAAPHRQRLAALKDPECRSASPSRWTRCPRSTPAAIRPLR